MLYEVITTVGAGANVALRDRCAFDLFDRDEAAVQAALRAERHRDDRVQVALGLEQRSLLVPAQ